MTKITHVKIKHAGKVYPIELDLTEPALTFKLQIASLTNVPPERQKIILKGGQLKDDSTFDKFQIKEGQTIMVLGTPLEQMLIDSKKPIETVKFIEDMNEGDLVDFNTMNQPSGLVNLGNTCYLNSSLQSLFSIDELKKDLIKFEKKSGDNMQLIPNMKDLFFKMNERKGKVTPLNFLSSMRASFPQFNERDNHGFFKQQDAEEAYSQILNTILLKFPDLERYFKIDFKTTTKCLETDEEPSVGFEDSLKLDCHINSSTNFLNDGLINGMSESLEKHNDLLNQNAQYEITRKITKLPKYLTVHFVRFFWKRETNKKAKIMRKVQFPFQLDVLEFLDDSIKEEKSKIRDEIYKVEKQNEEECRTFKKSKPNQELTTREQYEKQREELKDLRIKWEKNIQKVLPQDFKNDGENPSSIYELTSIIAHQGASADSGHYQAFVKDQEDLTGDRWYRFNDDKVTVVDREKIQSLSGGSEGDSALILVYKAIGL